MVVIQADLGEEKYETIVVHSRWPFFSRIGDNKEG